MFRVFGYFHLPVFVPAPPLTTGGFIVSWSISQFGIPLNLAVDMFAASSVSIPRLAQFGANGAYFFAAYVNAAAIAAASWVALAGTQTNLLYVFIGDVLLAIATVLVRVSQISEAVIGKNDVGFFAGFWQNLSSYSTNRFSGGKEADSWNLPLRSSFCYSISRRFSRSRPFAPLAKSPRAGFSLASASLHHRHHFLRRPSRRRTLVSLSSGVFSHAAWDIDVLSMYLAKLVATLLRRGYAAVGRR